ncbi:MAG: hypothetical protein HY775_07265 [Acidobacteria bacterium]|nr:hypothetical protein [Acidobacteriota bacterium]
MDTKRVVAVERPLGGALSRLARYRVADAYLRFWLRFVRPPLDAILRGRGDIATALLREGWRDYRGMAVEPVVRDAIERLLPDARFGRAGSVGSWWDRTGTVDVDLVGGEGPRTPTSVHFVGSIKWRERSGFASGTSLDVQLQPEDLLAAWRARP